MDLSSMFDDLPAHLPRPSSFPSPAEIRQKAREHSVQLFADHELLSRIVAIHEETIRKRWNKKSGPQRQRILREAGPDLPDRHRPDIRAWQQKSTDKKNYMCPFLNIEDLAKSKNMLILLYARGRHQPVDFVHADLMQAAFGEASGATMPAFLNEYTMMFHDRNTAETYGELVSWDDDENAFEYMYNNIGMHPGHGLQALEIQQHIWGFLVRWCQVLLRDISPLTTGDALPDPGSPVDQDVEVTSLQVIAMEAPYRIPARLDFLRLKALAAAERNAREDHLWSLREDPSYFVDVVQTFAEHRQEMILDTQGHKHPTLREPGRPLLWNRILGYMSLHAHFGFATYDEIFKQVQELERLYNRHGSALSPTSDLPSDLMDAFQDLRFLLDAAKIDLINSLRMELFASPPLRAFCSRKPQDPNTTKMSTIFSPPHRDHPVNRVMPFVNMLFDDQQLFLVGLHTIVDEIERAIRADTQVEAFMSPLIVDRISSLSAIAECLHQLHLFQPWARKIEDGMDQNKAKLSKRYNKKFEGWKHVLAAKFEGSQLYRLGDPSDGKFNYPSHRRRNKQNVEIMRKAEANLDLFWESVDAHYKSNVGGRSGKDMLAHVLSGDRAIQRTPEWIQPEKKKVPIAQDEYVYQQFSAIFHDSSAQVSGSFDRSTISTTSTKTKTRGVANVPGNSDTPDWQSTIPHESTNIDQSVAVDRRAFKVFKALFHSPNNPDQPGEVPWADFIHAMVTMGFSAEKAHGSAWNFFPKTARVDVERSIQFHEPHPSSKIPFHWARRYGRRLARAYGWTGEMFRLS
ncbi:hypothetical protein IQ07DRAFT_562298 [Pyrenochaeta sp. DS3sAY3a]|nr:hypothetical protein IQ07DRAFT_562298 [Pyrenochaeta sp. DS3sAY3a]